MAKNICVIGSGASGLTAIKTCLEEGFDVTCYEQSNFIGGLWKYRDQDEDGLASVARTTIINSSKEMSAYSDFPPPPEFANYMHNTAMHAYFELYADHFKLKPHVQFRHKVIQVTKADDFEKTGRWKVTALDLDTNNEVMSTFDGVMVCTGHHVKPLIPKFKGQEKFKGKIVHTHSYKKPQPFENERVVVVGIGNSGGDAAVELSMFAKKVYLAIRRGSWILWRVGTQGQPMDSELIRRFYAQVVNIVGFRVASKILQFFANLRFDHKAYRIQPSHDAFCQHPTVNDTLANRVISGTVVLKNNIKEFTETGVIFEETEDEIEIDSVILATGYEISFPFLDKSLLWSSNEKIELYKTVFPPKTSHPHTLAIIGLIQPFGPLVPISEMQCRWFTQLMSGRRKLPSLKVMMEDVVRKRADHDSRFYSSPRHQIQVDFDRIMDELGEQFGAKPNLTKLFFSDPVLWYHVYFGPLLPYHYRINGPHAWSGARKAIMTVDERIQAPLQTRKLINVSTKSNDNLGMASFIIPIFAILICLIKFWFP